MQVYGHVWGETEAPDLSSNLKSEHTGTEAGTFKDKLSELKPETKYYVCPYSKDGDEVIYKDAISFTTLPELQVLKVVTNEVTEILYVSATCGGNITNEGESSVTARGVCWSTPENPTMANDKTEDGTGTGAFVSSLTALSDNSTYYVRAYAVNADGTSYGEQKSFATFTYSMPTVTTDDITEITFHSAKSGGTVTSDGGHSIEDKGICWSTSQNPTTSSSSISSGTGMASFTSVMNDLNYDQTYYVRAYAQNSEGISYGEQKIFATNALTVGDYYLGGIIFYLDSEENEGLVCYEKDLNMGGDMWWGEHTYFYGADLTDIGTGFDNTLIIVNDPLYANPSAAYICYYPISSINGYEAWFLPSRDELLEICTHKTVINQTALENGGTSFQNNHYWSSSELDLATAFSVNFDNCIEASSPKNTNCFVRPVRKFTYSK